MRIARDIQTGGDSKLANPKNVLKLQQILDDLPDHNLVQLRYINAFFVELAKYSDTNKMTAANIGIVMGSNLLWLVLFFRY